MRLNLPAGGLISLLALGTPPTAVTQVRASERGTISQMVDGTLIEVSFSRPRLRGRVPFGGLVRWGEVWTPGANWATTLKVSREIRLNEQPVPAGEYSVWMLPTEARWTVYLHKDPKLFHTQRPKPADMFLALEVTPAEAPPAEMLTFSFPEVRRDGVTLLFQWGTKSLTLQISVTPTARNRPRLSPEEVEPYLGEYTAWLFGERGDSTELRPRLFYEDGRLKGASGARRFELFPTGVRHQFWFESHDEAGPYDVEQDSPVVFAIDPSGRASGFSMKGIEQAFWMVGTRLR